MANIDWGIVVSICSLIIMVYTTIRTNAKSEEKTHGELQLIKNDVKHLSDRVEKHNGVIERTYKLEQDQAVLKEEMKVEQHRMDDVETAVEKQREKYNNLIRRQ